MTVEELIARFLQLDAEMGDRLECVVATWPKAEGELEKMVQIRLLGKDWRWSDVIDVGPAGKKGRCLRLTVEGDKEALRQMVFLAERAMPILDGKPKALDAVFGPLQLRGGGQAMKRLRGSPVLMWCMWATLASASGMLGDAMPPAPQDEVTSELLVNRVPQKRRWHRTTLARPFRESAGLLEVIDAEALAATREARAKQVRIKEQRREADEKLRQRDAEALERREQATREAQLARPMSLSEGIESLRAFADLPPHHRIPPVYDGAGLVILKMVRLGALKSQPTVRALVLAHDVLPRGPQLVSIWFDAATTMRGERQLAKATFDTLGEDAQAFADILTAEGPLSSAASDAADGKDIKVPVVSDGTFLSETDLATTFGVNRDSLRTRLRAWRPHHLNNDWHRVEHPRPNDPKFLYRVGSVRPLIEALRKPAENRPE